MTHKVQINGFYYVGGSSNPFIPYTSLSYKEYKNSLIEYNGVLYPILYQYENLLITSKNSFRRWVSYTDFSGKENYFIQNKFKVIDLENSVFEKQRDVMLENNWWNELQQFVDNVKHSLPNYYDNHNPLTTEEQFINSVTNVIAFDKDRNIIYKTNCLMEGFRKSNHIDCDLLICETKDNIYKLKDFKTNYTLKLIEEVITWYDSVKHNLVELLNNCFKPIVQDETSFKYGEWVYLESFANSKTPELHLEYSITFEQMLQMYEVTHNI